MLHPDALNRIVIKIYVGYFQVIAIPHCYRIHTKTMVLRSDLRLAGDQIFYRVIQAAVAMVHFVCRYVIGFCQQLVPEADTKEWFLRRQYVLYRCNRIVHRSRIAGAVGYEVTIRFEFFKRVESRLCREYLRLPAR